MDKQTILDRLDKHAFYGKYLRDIKVSGHTAKALCPFHDDHNPSLSVNLDNGLFNCFSCGAGGSPIDFLMKKHKIDFQEAFDWVAMEAGVKLEWKHAEELEKENTGLVRLDAVTSEIKEAKSEDAADTKSFEFGPTLLPLHLIDLRKSGLSDETIKETKVYSVSLQDVAKIFNNPKVESLLAFPYPNTNYVRYKLFSCEPVIDKDGHAIRYYQPKGSENRLYISEKIRTVLSNPSIPLHITEGEKKTMKMNQEGLPCIGLGGLWNWVDGSKEKNLIPDFDLIELSGRTVFLDPDNDFLKPNRHGEQKNLEQAVRELGYRLIDRGAKPFIVYLPEGAEKGVDDYLCDHSVEEFKSLPKIEIRKQTEAAAPSIEILKDAPATISKPLALVNGTAYAATWLHFKRTITQSLQNGKAITLSSPIVKTERGLYLIREDGVVFGDGKTPMKDLPVSVALAEIPPSQKLWTAGAVEAYQNGYRPTAADVFMRLTDIVDRFIDFNKSLATQRTMSEMIACYVLGTWFLDGFNVIGFIWPNGDRGCGKTQLITLTAELSYLGMVVLSGGSFASLRDMADYGATLAFDDAEGLSDPKKTDPDKRALLLAGNRRGNTVPVKEPGPNRTWRTRYVNTFCPRLFSATRLPDPILSSRTIIVPLIRTPDRHRANADVLDFSLWPHDRQKLIDDLWALAVSWLHELPKYEAEVNKKSKITGRTLEPWRSLLSVALWLSENGVPELWDRMESLSMDYQTERPELESSDMTALVIKALCRYADNAVDAVNIESHTFSFKTAEVVSLVKTLIEETEADIDSEHVTSRRIGRVLGRMRLTQDRTSKCKGWKIHVSELIRWTKSYGISWVNDKYLTLSVNGTNGTNGITAREVQLDLLPKCQDCVRTEWPCLLTPDQRLICEGPFSEEVQP